MGGEAKAGEMENPIMHDYVCMVCTCMFKWGSTLVESHVQGEAGGLAAGLG